MLLPSDDMAVRNLLELICDNDALPTSLREPSAVVSQVLRQRGHLRSR